MFEGAAFEKITENPAEDEDPFLWVGELLRSVANGCEERTDSLQRSLHLWGFGVQAGKGHGGLPTVSSLFCQQRSAAAGGW